MRYPDLEIVISCEATPVEVFAAEELQHYLNLGTGRQIPIERTASGHSGKIVLGAAAHDLLPDWSGTKSRIKHDGFVIHSGENVLLICGIEPRGTLNGVYSLLYNLGFRWFFPRESEEVIPSLKQFSLVRGSRIVNPDLEFRGVYIYPIDQENVENLKKTIDWMGKNRINMLMTSIINDKPRKLSWIGDWEKVSDQLLPEIQKRGIVLNLSGHSGRYFFPTSYFEKYPAWFAMNSEGKRFSSGQLCYSNAEAVSVLAENYAKYLVVHPEVDIIGTWPEDGYGFCQCEQCREPGAVLKAVNKIAERIEQVRPDLTVEYLSYTKETSDVPPDILPRRNIVTLVAHTRVAEAWLKKSDAVGGRGVYRLHYHIADNTAERANLPLRFEKTRLDCLAAKETGLRGIIPFLIGIDTWWRSSLNLYFMTQFSWDTNTAAKDLLADYCRAYYGAAADEVRPLLEELEEIPIVQQSLPPPWPLWQNWPTLKADFTGAKWKDTLDYFSRLRRRLESARRKGEESAVPPGRFDAIDSFIACQETMFAAWHERALAVLAFERNEAAEVREHITATAKYEQNLLNMLERSRELDDGVNGAWIDYSFFLNWRLQLDKQLIEMRTSEQKMPVIDENSEMELFLPGLLNL